MALLYQAAALSPRSTGGAGGPRFRCPSPRLPQAHLPSLCRSRRTRPHPHPRPPETSPNLPSRSPHPQSPVHLGHRQARPLQVPRTRSAPWTPITWSCSHGKCVPVSASGIWPSIQKNPRKTPPAISAFTATNPISSRSIQKPSSKRLSNSWPAQNPPSSRYQFRALPNPRPCRPKETCSGPQHR